jgi:hypothetical protein
MAHSCPCSDLSDHTQYTCRDSLLVVRREKHSTLTVPGQRVETSKLLAATFTFKWPEPLMQEHVPLAIMLPRKANDS